MNSVPASCSASEDITQHLPVSLAGGVNWMGKQQNPSAHLPQRLSLSHMVVAETSGRSRCPTCSEQMYRDGCCLGTGSCRGVGGETKFLHRHILCRVSDAGAEDEVPQPRSRRVKAAFNPRGSQGFQEASWRSNLLSASAPRWDPAPSLLLVI